MIQFDTVDIQGRSYTYLRVEMGKAPFLLLKGDRGYVMCGYLNTDAAAKLDDMGVRVSGVKDLETLLSSKVAECTPRASEAGIKQGDTVSEIIGKL